MTWRTALGAAEVAGAPVAPGAAEVAGAGETAGAGEKTKAIGHVFLMMGAVPSTHWLKGCIALNDKGFVRTGPDLTAEDFASLNGTARRPVQFFETNWPGIFAVGDVRCGSVKRVAAAVGEGSACVQQVHQELHA